jgi:hypothetical protein
MKRPVAILFLAAYGLSATALAWAAEPSEPEQLHAAVQAICPVSGVELGEHGPPVRVVVGDQDQELFLCCKACLNKQINPEHWATIHANTFQAQHRCPVMKNPLPADASWQIVNGRVVFVCCPPCLDKIAKSPESHLDLVDSFYAESLAKKAQE